MKKIIYVFAFLACSFAFGQDYGSVIGSYLNSNRAEFGLQAEDVADLSVTSQSFSKSMGLQNVYVAQQYQGIEIFNSVSSFAVKDGQVVSEALSFTKNLASKVNATAPSISAATAISKAAAALGLQSPGNLTLLETAADHSFVYSNGNISQENIPVKLVFQPTESNGLRLAWDLSIYLLDGSHWYSVRIDAITGDLISTHDWVVSCDFGEGSHSHSNDKSGFESILFGKDDSTESYLGGSQYRVFPMPVESPSHGSDALVSDPADAVASPFGWHDTNGDPTPEYTITRGNNVYAQDDIDGNDGTVGFSPDGGATLDFDFNHNPNTAPINRLEGAITNLFYWNNIMHDVWYQYGFDEESGNFQENNYGNGGQGSDSVDAHAQDGSGTNNANFATPSDGQNPRMQMYLWNAVGPPGEPLTINNGPLAGDYVGLSAQFGAPLTPTPITADLALVEDDDAGVSVDPNDGCDNITNGGALNGKIVVIRRGECEFGFKVLNAENEGAIAVIIVNNVPGSPIAMGPGVDGGNVTIPSIMISQADGEPIITALDNGQTVNGTLVEAPPFMIDGDLDSGIVAHEYGHGISNRLTGSSVGCLQNEEQMGEGWSDWFGLMLTMETGDEGSDPRGIGTYALGQPVLGTGLRAKRYSTDFAINDFTYADSNTQIAPHGVGSVWATMLWDLTWALVDEYGFDTDFYNGTGGNNIAMQLVIDGLKLQPCSPGFVDGRDAILEADELANGGANRCLIWEVFATRGLGASASQGSSNNSHDQQEAFDMPTGPDCTLASEDTGSFNNNFLIYPNPSNGEINIKSVVNVGDATVSIFDMNGRKVFSETVELHNTANINAGGLNTGVYVIQIDGGNYSHTAKLIIQ